MNYQNYGLKIGFPAGMPARYKNMKFTDYNITVKDAIQYITTKQLIPKPELYVLQITYSDGENQQQPQAINQSGGSTNSTPLSGSIGMPPPSDSNDLKKSSSSGIVNNNSSIKKIKWMEDNEKLVSYPLNAPDVVIELKKKYQLVKVYDGKQTLSLIVDVTRPLNDLMGLVSGKFKLKSNGDYKLFNAGKEINLNNDVRSLNIDTSIPFILRDNNDPNAISIEQYQNWESDDDEENDINNNLSVPAKSIINPVKEGYLKKLDKKKSWKTRYFKLTDKYLYWYKSPTCVKASGMVICKDYHIKLAPTTHTKEYKLELTPKNIVTGATTIIHFIKFENENELKQWCVPPIVLESVTGSSSTSTTPLTTPNQSRFTSNKNKIFGVPIEKTILPGQTDNIPIVVSQTMDYIEKKAMDITGIFRLSGSATTIEQWKLKYDKGEKVDLNQETDPHAVAGLLKLFFRELPDPLLTYERYDNFIAAQCVDDFPSRIKLIKHLVKSLPPVNYAVLSKLMLFLGKVATHSANNKMQNHNLSTVFGPNLIKDRPNDNDIGGNIQALVEDTPTINGLTLSLIRDYQYIFNDKEIPEQIISAKTLYEYLGNDESNEDDKDLIFPKGVIIRVKQQGTDGWWQGEYQGKSGKFPASYVELLPQSQSPSTLLRTKSNSNLSKKKKFMMEMESTKSKNQDLEKNNKQLLITKQELQQTIRDLEYEKSQLEKDPSVQPWLSLLKDCKSNKDISLIPKNTDLLLSKFEEYKASNEALSNLKSTLIEEYEQFNNNPKKRLESKEKESLQSKYDSLSSIIDKSQKIRSKSINQKKAINDDFVEIKKIFSL